MRQLPQEIPKIARECLEAYLRRQLAILAEQGYRKRDEVIKELKSRLEDSELAEFLGLQVESIEKNINDQIEYLNIVFSTAALSIDEFVGIAIPSLIARIPLLPSIDVIDGLPTFSLPDFPYSIEVSFAFSGPNYEIAIAGQMVATRDRDSSSKLSADIRWKDPSLRIRALIGESSRGGVLFNGYSDLPFAIPIASTGLGLSGIGIVYAEGFAPNLPALSDGATEDQVISVLSQAKPEAVQDWAKNKIYESDGWVSLQSTGFKAYGISAAIGDLSSNGEIIGIKELGLTYLNRGPIILLSGDLSALKQKKIASVQGVIDTVRKLIALRAEQHLDFLVATFKGQFEFIAELEHPLKALVRVGGEYLEAATVTFLNILSLYGGLQIKPFEGAIFKASGYLSCSGSLLGFSGGINISLSVGAQLAWNPVLVSGRLQANGYAWLSLWGYTLGLGFGVDLEARFPDPKKLHLRLRFTLSLCWPLDDIHFEADIFNIGSGDYRSPASPLQFSESSTGIVEPIGTFHAASGIQGELTEKEENIYPDTAILIPFQQRANQGGVTRATIFNSEIDPNKPPNAPYFEAGQNVTHTLNKLEIWKIDPDDAENREIVPDVKACWLETDTKHGFTPTSTLAIPCSNPLAWLNPFDYAQPSEYAPENRFFVQTFGNEPNETVPVVGGRAEKVFGQVIVSSYRPLEFVGFPFKSTRLLAIGGNRESDERNVTFFTVPKGAKTCEIHIISRSKPSAWGPTWDKHPAIREIGKVTADLSEWSVLLTRNDESEADDSICINFGDEEFFSCWVFSIGWSERSLGEIVSPPTSLLKPGRYELVLEGSSSSSAAKAPPQDWALQRQFNVIAPPLRPYIRFSTLGDERNFQTNQPGWNPNPLGIGFGHYLNHSGVIRSNVGYMDKIYKDIWFRINGESLWEGGVLDGKSTAFSRNDSHEAGTKISIERSRLGGGPRLPEQEYWFNFDASPGEHRIEIFKSDPSGGDLNDLIDQWDFRVSDFTSAVSHLTPRECRMVFGPFGTNIYDLSGIAQLDSYDFGSIQIPILDIALSSGWLLPAFVSDWAGTFSENAGAHFLAFLDWCGIFDAPRQLPARNVLDQAEITELCVLYDTGHSAVGLLFKTPEPCDWRRVKIRIAVDKIGGGIKILEGALIPSADGCHSIVVGKLDGVAVRLPKGKYVVEVTFCLEQENLPRLRFKNDKNIAEEKFVFSFWLRVGQTWGEN
ncbi:MAG: hypothetical protein HS105_05385 [Chloracidobacterium sp.]|nr:hypothetical protein [Chloracidobacterium sp.]